MSEKIVFYGKEQLQRIRIFNYSESNDKTLIVLHGGGWRDPRNSYNDFEDMANYILEEKKATNINIIGIDYRLSPFIKHPVHLIDVLTAFRYILENYKTGQLLIVGHSVGATLLLEILNYVEIIQTGLEQLETSEPLIEELQTLFDFILKNLTFKTMYFLDGIYDVRALLEEYPSYDFFVKSAFVSTVAIEEASQLSWKQHNEAFKIAVDKYEILHSLEDELLSLNQPKLFAKYLQDRKIECSFRTGNWGEHEQVYRSQAVSEHVLQNM